MEILGIDVGGSGIKGAVVDTEKGKLLTDRFRIPTPQPATPKKIAQKIQEMVHYFEWEGPIGCGFPAVIRNDIVRTASNIDKKWIGKNITELFSEKTGCPVNIINDADAAGLAEMSFGAGKDFKGVAIIVTVGTGIGSSLFVNGNIVPNSELGHVFLKGTIAEQWTSDAARKRNKLSWEKWGKRFNKYLNHLESLFWPDRIIIGGGASKKHEKYFHELKVQSEIIEAKLLNNAGIIGAALAVTKNGAISV